MRSFFIQFEFNITYRKTDASLPTRSFEKIWWLFRALWKDQIEEKDEEVLEAVYKLGSKHNLIRNILFNIYRQFGHSCCVTDFASIDIYLNATASRSISITHFEEIATKYVFVMTFPKSVAVVDLYDMGIYMLVPDTREDHEYFTQLLL